MKSHSTAVVAAFGLACTASHVAAQGNPRSAILDLKSTPEIRTQVDQRYQAALAQTLSRDILAKDDPRYAWASEAKVACGIALGYLKTNTVDAESINKCDNASKRMTVIPAPPAPPPARPAQSPAPPPRPLPPPPPPPAPKPAAACTLQMPAKIYFEFNGDRPPSEAREVVGKIAQGMSACGWSTLSIVGHADRSGSQTYNQALSERRAKSVADISAAAGIPATATTVDAKGETMPAVPTADGVREPLNRRVEVTATSGK